MAEKKQAPISMRADINADKAEKEKALKSALANIKKQFGEGAVMRLGADSPLNLECIPTGSLSLDIALGVGGLPRGRIIEIYGPESSGKTTLALHCIAEGQKMGGNAAFIDVEHALDPVYAANLGVSVDDLLVSQPDTGEQALEITEALVRSNAIDVIVIDSVAALVPRAEIEGDMGDSHVGLQARLMSQALRKLAGAIAKSNSVCIFINQLREKVGVMYGSPEVTPGGRALKFYSSVRIDVRKGEVIKNGSDVIGAHTKAKVIRAATSASRAVFTGWRRVDLKKTLFFMEPTSRSIVSPWIPESCCRTRRAELRQISSQQLLLHLQQLQRVPPGDCGRACRRAGNGRQQIQHRAQHAGPNEPRQQLRTGPARVGHRPAKAQEQTRQTGHRRLQCQHNTAAELRGPQDTQDGRRLG